MAATRRAAAIQSNLIQSNVNKRAQVFLFARKNADSATFTADVGS